MIDKDTIEQLFRQNYSRMIRLARILLDDDGEAEDIVQDVFVRLLNRFQANRPESQAFVASITTGYLLTAVHHGCMNLIRQKSLRERLCHFYPIDDESDTPERLRMEQLEVISQIIAEHITEPQLTVFRLRFDENLTMQEIANRTGLAIGTVHKYLQQCIRKVRLHFKQEKS